MGKILEERLPGRDNVVPGCVILFLCTCCTCGVVYVSYMLCCVHVVLCHVYCVFIIFYSVYIYVLCCTLGVCVCVVLYTKCRYMWCRTLGVGLRFLCCTLCMYVLYNVMGQVGMGLFGPLLLILRVEVVYSWDTLVDIEGG